MFRTKWCNIIATWCIKHFQQYGESPGRNIETVFATWAERTKNKPLAGLIEMFLESLSGEYEDGGHEINSEYIIDLAGKHFNHVQLETLAEVIQAHLSQGEQDKALDKITTWNKIELGVGAGVSVLGDMEAIQEAFAEKGEPLVGFPGALGEFFGDSLERDGFIAFMGPDKRGKSFWLSEISYRALLRRCRVAYFEAGDLSQNQLMRRLMCRISRHPMKAGTVDYPIRIVRPEGEFTAVVETEERKFNTPLSWRRAWKSAREIMEKRVRSNEPLWKLSCHPNSTLSVNGVRSILDGWSRENGWTPDVIVIDYADIMASDHARLEPRDQNNERWKQLRALSQSLHCLVVTATQTDADAYKRNVITKSNFSEDKRKLAHVTGMIGLNQTPEEDGIGVMRLNWVVRREGAFQETKCVHVARCLALANPSVISCW
jgi:hypothetical protein